MGNRGAFLVQSCTADTSFRSDEQIVVATDGETRRGRPVPPRAPSPYGPLSCVSASSISEGNM